MRGIKKYIIASFGGTIITLAVIFSIIFITAQKNILIREIDKDLYNIVKIEKELFSPDFHDNIVDENSITPEQYYEIVDRNNRLCKELNLQYLWSVIKIGDKIHFTTATSPDKEVKNNKQAGFFDIHSNPEAFDKVFSEMKPTISEFHNEWGNGRMILAPFTDIHGRKYCFGASISTNDVNAQIRRSIFFAILILGILLLIFIPIIYLLGKSISQPIKSITDIANDIASGKPIQPLLTNKQKKWKEIFSLSNSISTMYDEIQNKIEALQSANIEIEESKENLRNQNLVLDKIVEERTKELNQLVLNKDRFIRILAHDLRNPFNTLLGFSDLLNENLTHYDIENIKQQIKIISHTSHRIYNLLDDLLLWSKSNDGKLPFKPENCDVTSICADVVELGRTNASDKKITLNCLSEENIYVEADKNMLKTILRNLVFNAIKFSNENSSVRIKAEKKAEYVMITVSDDGVGISSENIPKLWDFEDKYTNHGTKGESGSGLGLILCKEFVEKHGGKIWVESELGKGSDFIIQLPVSVSSRQ